MSYSGNWGNGYRTGLSTYVVGDIHGNHEGLLNLLTALEFRPGRDRLWCVGDIVNRGPGSVECIQTIMSLGSSARCVMGNHELLLLACAWGFAETVPDSLETVLDHPDSKAMLTWVRHLPFLIHDRRRRVLVVHAGLPPHWTLPQAGKQAKRLHKIMISRKGPEFLREAFERSHNAPELLHSEVSSNEEAWRLRGANSPYYAVHALTMLRRCGPMGEISMHRDEYDGARSDDVFEPWFEYPRPGPRAEKTHYVFGHWAALDGVDRQYLHGLDTGCVRGGLLTAYEVETDRLHHMSCDDVTE
ncbi:MAG: symmetrical bis(5'-nucleosyl)-tetraphosphatase [Spirochaetaceae bacterium]|nr:MAG: symmetrical bis(5'-nucleosyl)-tetraphosphatase [Spirochaetaceae bacterium]